MVTCSDFNVDFERQIKYNEEQLVACLFSKDIKQFEVIYDCFSTPLFFMINQMVDSEEAAQDVLKESFLSIWNNSKTYSPKKTRLFAWMLNIARNKAKDYVLEEEILIK
jgi:DNA-directed RNA polymerase specialized sigma24 family protein